MLTFETVYSPSSVTFYIISNEFFRISLNLSTTLSILDNNKQTLILDTTLVPDSLWVMQGPTSGPLNGDETVFVEVGRGWIRRSILNLCDVCPP